MKVQLIVVQGKPEGKMIPLQTPSFKIGRGETCNLRPNSEEVSREHAEFSVKGDTVAVRDLGSRNGTLVNGKRLTEPCKLKDSDLIQIGPLTFAISIEGAPAPVAAKAPAKAPAKPKSPDDISHDDIESWLVSDASSAPPERPSGIYGGDTQTMKAFKAKPGAGNDPVPVVDDESETRMRTRIHLFGRRLGRRRVVRVRVRVRIGRAGRRGRIRSTSPRRSPR